MEKVCRLIMRPITQHHAIGAEPLVELPRVPPPPPASFLHVSRHSVHPSQASQHFTSCMSHAELPTSPPPASLLPVSTPLLLASSSQTEHFPPASYLSAPFLGILLPALGQEYALSVFHELNNNKVANQATLHGILSACFSEV